MLAPRFLVDAMLGSLARWLRILGFDAAYDPTVDDAELVEQALAEDRILLTRDRRLVLRRRARRYLLIEDDGVESQLRQVLDALGIDIDPADVWGRCLRCNRPLETAETDWARERVPPFVARTQRRFRRCPGCERIYWRATHVEAMADRLRSMGIRVRGRPDASG